MTKETWINDFYFIGGNECKTPAKDALKFAVSYPQKYSDILKFKLDQTIRWLRVLPWKSTETYGRPISHRELMKEARVHAAVAYNITPRKTYDLKIQGTGRNQYLAAKVYAPNLAELETAGLESKISQQPQKTLESLAKYLTLIGGLRDGNLFLRGAAACNKDRNEVVLFPGSSTFARQRGKTLALLHFLSKGYEPISNSHIWLKFTNKHLYVYPQRAGELPLRIKKSQYEGELTFHNLDVESIESTRKNIGAKSLNPKLFAGNPPEDILLRVNAPESRIKLDIPLDKQKLLVLWPEDLSLASGELALVNRINQPEDILQNLRKSWTWNKDQISLFYKQFAQRDAPCKTIKYFTDNLTLNDYIATIVSNTIDPKKEQKFFEDILKPEFYREAHGSPCSLLSELHEKVYKTVSMPLEDRLGAPIKSVLETLTTHIKRFERDTRITKVEVEYYDVADLHRLFHDGMRPLHVKSHSTSYESAPQAIRDVINDKVIEDIFRLLAIMENARRILGLKLFGSDGTVIGSYGLASLDGIYLDKIATRLDTQ